MNKIVSLYLSRRDVPTRMDVVQGATTPGITFILEDYEPNVGAQAQIFIKKKESEVFNACTVSGNTVTFSPSTGTFDQVGECQGQLQIVSGGKIAVSYRLFIKVEPNIIDGDAIEASDDFSALQEALIEVGDISEYKAQTTQNTSDIAGIKTKTDKIIYASGIEDINFGTQNKTRSTYFWGNTTNKVGLGAYNNEDEKRYNLLARANEFVLQDESSNRLWTILPSTYSPGETITITNAMQVIATGFITNATKDLRFLIPLPRNCVGRTITFTPNASTGLSVRLGTGGYLNGTQYIDATTSEYTITTSANVCGVTIVISKSTAYTGAVNNSSCSVAISGTLTFS